LFEDGVSLLSLLGFRLQHNHRGYAAELPRAPSVDGIVPVEVAGGDQLLKAALPVFAELTEPLLLPLALQPSSQPAT
jgi:hypothetical protein